jgi:iron complex outermembrane receptor protein
LFESNAKPLRWRIKVARRDFRSGKSGSVRLTPLAAAVITALYPVGPALAQDEAVPSDEPVEEVIVTGSRIRRDTFSSAAPMEVVLTEAAAPRGITDVASLLQTTTVAAGAPQVTAASSSVFVENGGLGASTLSIRGLGPNRTLILLNGRRAGPSGVQGGVSSFDLNAIPMTAIERVEILKDGASSIYGSDAVAGVVNIITKKEDGAEFDAFFSAPQESGGEQMRLSGSWGKTFERGRVRVTADYNKIEIMQRRDRDFFDCEEQYIFDPETGERVDPIDPRTGSPLCDDLPWGHVWVYDYAESYGDGTTNVGAPPFLLQYDFDGLLAANGLPPLAAPANPYHMTAPAGWYPVSQGDRLSNSLIDAQHPLHGTQTLIPENEAMTFFLEGEYSLTDSVTAYSEVLLNRRETVDVGYRQIWTYIYNYDSAGLADDGWLTDPFSAGWTGAQWLSPLSITDHSDQEITVDYTRFVAGLTGETMPVLESWTWDLSLQYSKSDGEYTNDRVLKDALEYPFFRTGSCVGETTPISNRPCVDIQWLDPDFLAGDIPQEVKNYLFDVETGNTEYTQWSMEAVMTGDVFEVPAGSVAAAIGLHYREDEILDTPGPITLAGNAWQDDAAGITAGDDSTYAVFGEIDVPLLADRPLVKFLDFNASARFTDVDSYGSDTTYKVGMNWAFTDSFRARSTFGTSFRAPALYELYLANQSSFISARSADPCINWASNLAQGNISQRIADNCAADGIPPDHIATVGPTVLTGGGAGVLEAETSEAFTFGLVWQPAFAEVNLSVDYFDILVEDEVDKIGGPEIVAGCYASPFFPNEPLCDQFDRSAADAPLPNAILTIRDSFINVAKQEIRGVDVAALWTQDIAWGTLSVDTKWTFNFEDTNALFDETEEDFAGEAGHPETVGNLYVSLDVDQWSFFYGMNYIGETDNFASFGRNTVTNDEGELVNIDLIAEATTYHSLSAAYNFESGLVARAGVANLLDEEPPRMTSLGTATEVDIVGEVAFYSQYDWLGRRFFVNLTMGF